MATISEDYVSFETAKLLKEKGFDKDWVDGSIEEYLNGTEGYSLPTLAATMKWLREVHNLYIEVSLSCDREDKNAKIFDASIFNVQNQRYKKLSNIQGYEQAVEAAIKYCLENLI